MAKTASFMVDDGSGFCKWALSSPQVRTPVRNIPESTATAVNSTHYDVPEDREDPEFNIRVVSFFSDG